MHMRFIRDYHREIIFFVIILALFLALRLTHILSLPIFTDEAIYVRWAQIAKQDANWRFISLTDGKQPLFVWLEMISMHFFKDPLFAGRIVSVFAGLGSMIGLFFLGRELFKNRWIGLLSAFIYVIFPFSLVYDRMAIYDSLVGTFSIWSMYLEVLLIRKIRLDIALITGMVIGGSVLNKSSGFGNIYFLPFSFLLFPFQKNKWIKSFFAWLGYAVLVIIIANLYYSILRLSPFFHIVKDKDAVFIYPLSEWIRHPFTFFYGNLRGLFDWFQTYISWVGIILVIFSFIVERKYLREKMFLLFWFLAPFLLAALFGRVLYPRYILFMSYALLPLIALSVFHLFQTMRSKLIFGIVLLVSFGMWVYADFTIINDFAHAPLPQSDLDQYVNGWPAGGGVSQSVSFFREKSKNSPIYVATEGTFGLMPFSYEIYFNDNPRVTVKGYWPIQDMPPAELINAAKHMPTYVVFYEPCPSCVSSGVAPVTWPIHLVARYQKGTGTNYLSVYQFRQ